MGRPTSEKKDKAIKLRISDELYERLERESGGNMSGHVREILSGGNSDEMRGLIAENNALKEKIKELSKAEGTPKIMSDETYKDLTRMCELSGVSLVEFFDEVCRLFNEGRLEFECMKLKSKGEYDLEYLLDVCHRANVDPQEMINKLANSLVRR